MSSAVRTVRTLGHRTLSRRTVSRRVVLGAAAALAATPGWTWVAGPRGAFTQQTLDEGESWKPKLFSKEQAETVERLCEAIIPRTDTPGARDALTHQFIDLELSLAEDRGRAFLEGLAWLQSHCKRRLGRGLARISEEELAALLEPLSDRHSNHPAELVRGALFFEDLKRRTIFAYYTSKPGRVEELGWPEQVTMEKWQGCSHGDGKHA